MIFFKVSLVEIINIKQQGSNSLVVGIDEYVFVIEDDFEGAYLLIFFEDEDFLFFELFFPLLIVCAVLVGL